MNRSAILTYHSLDDSGSVVSVEPETFRRQMRLLAEARVPVVPLEEAARRPGSVAITFDDGFASFHRHAFPVLREHGFPATVFAVSGYCGKRNDWPTQSPGIPLLPLMSWAELDEAARHGVSVGAHTVNHPRLGALPLEEAEREMADCRDEIEQRLGRKAASFAYPYGDAPAAVRKLAARRFEIACTVRMGYAAAGQDPAACPRLDVYYYRDPYWFARLLGLQGRVYTAARSALRMARQLLLPA